MKSRFQLLLLTAMLIANATFAFGPIGHRTIAKVAEYYLTDSAKEQIIELLDGESIITVSTFADDIKSDRKYDYTHVWHYVNVDEGKSYADSKKNPNGDLILAINNSIEVLKNPKSSKEDKAFNLKMLVHLIGDLHQPLHCGRGSDKGGNDIKLKWFKRGTNLHRVWDSDMINSNKYSFTELAESIKKPPYINKEEIESGNVLTWYQESKELSEVVYASAQADENLYYSYNYKYFPVVKKQLNYAGIRLAKVLNDIFK
ncbi:MAG: S1/P1 nuclease [Flavobacteriales bacterium]|nr:S1/P1 nuclease [Flavobacteriales bacterium]